MMTGNFPNLRYKWTYRSKKPTTTQVAIWLSGRAFAYHVQALEFPPKCWEKKKSGKREAFLVVDRNITWYSHYENSMEVPQRIESRTAR
jgi:hypothetical protein